MMRRPADQAKLLLLYFLRYSSAAFASEPIKASVTKSSLIVPSANTTPLIEGHISLRVATRTDIPSIQRCNLATLPENYNANFYMHHLRTWPELALVMEHVPKRREARISSQRVAPGTFYEPGKEPPLEIIGYVLGKVDQSLKPPRSRYQSSRVNGGDDGFAKRDYTTSSYTPPERETLGHVTSLAILNSYRRRGLAGHLMNQLHYHMKERYSADAVGLHVRVSNEAATKLYIDSMGYKIAEVIKGYYQDGEDAYLMRKEFENCDEKVSEPSGMNSSLGGVNKRWFSALGGGYNKWSMNKDMLLPRKIPLINDVNGSSDPRQVIRSVREEASEQVHAQQLFPQ